MYRLMQPSDEAAVLALWQSQHHDTEDFAKMVLERFAGVQNIYVADENDTIVAAALAVPVTLQGRTGNYLCLCGEGSLLLAGLLDTLCAQQKLRGAGFTVAVPADAAQAALLQDKGFAQAFALRCLPREVSRNLWSQAEFDTVTAKKLCELREQFWKDTVQLSPERMAVVLQELYARGATIVSNEHGYGIYFRKEDTLYFVEMMADSDRAAYKMGAKRVVLAREMTLQDIAILRDKTPPELEIEAFVHGAMCMSVSGRCLLSNYMAGRDANRGQCAQPCRWKYYLSEETRPGQLYEIGENENGSYILNANDMCTAPFIDLICKAGVDSLKIEGRAKTFYYVASVTAAYRKALDAYLADPANDNFELPPEVYAELTRTSHRHYSPGFYFGREQAKQATDSATYIREWEFVGTVDSWENGIAHCQQRGKWSLGDTLEALCPDGRSIPLTPEWIENEAGERVESTPHAMEKYTMPTPELPPMSLLRRKTV